MQGSIPIKTQEEIEFMRHAGRILTETLNMLEKEVRAGISTLELDEKAEAFIRSHEGATPGFKGYHGFTGSICVSINEEVVHGIPHKDRILEEGDIIGVDCGVYYKGFHTDACRTFFVGEVAPEVRHFVKTTKKALDNAVKVVKPGVRVGDISARIQKSLEDFDYAPVVDCTGHGVGRELHEPPEVLNAGVKGTGPELKAGMVLAIEPISTMGKGAVYTAEDGWTVLPEDGSFSAHFERTVLVTDSGHEVLAF